MSGALLAAAARELDQRRAAQGGTKRYDGATIWTDLRPFFHDDTSSSEPGANESSDFSDGGEPGGNANATFMTTTQATAAGAPLKSPKLQRKPPRRHRASYEKPFDPVEGPRQLAHAKQRIRDLEEAFASRGEELHALKGAMAKHAELMDYIKTSLLQDTLSSLRLDDDKTGSRRAGAYHLMVTTLLDDERLLSLQTEMRQLMANNANDSRDTRISQLEAKEAKLSARIARLVAKLDTAALDTQAAHRDVVKANEGTAAGQRAIHALQQELSTMKLRVLERDEYLFRKEGELESARRDIALLAKEVEELKSAAAEKDEALEQAKRQAENTKENLERSMSSVLQCVRDVATAQERAGHVSIRNLEEWPTARAAVAESIERLRKSAKMLATGGEALGSVAGTIASCATIMAVDGTTIRQLVQTLNTAADSASSGASKLNESLAPLVATCDRLDSIQLSGNDVVDRESDLQIALMDMVSAASNIEHSTCQTFARRCAQFFARELAAWRNAVAAMSIGSPVLPHPSDGGPAQLSIPRPASFMKGKGGATAASAAQGGADAYELEDLSTNTDGLDALLDQLLNAKPAAAKELRAKVAAVLGGLKATLQGAAGKAPVVSLRHCVDMLKLLEKENALAVKSFDDPFAPDLDRLQKKAGPVLTKQQRLLSGSTLPPILGGGSSFDAANAIAGSPETQTIAEAEALVNLDAMGKEYAESAAAVQTEVTNVVRDVMKVAMAMLDVPRLCGTASVLSSLCHLVLGGLREAEHWANTAFLAAGGAEDGTSYGAERSRVLAANSTSDGSLNRAPPPTTSGLDLQRAIPTLVTAAYSTITTAASPLNRGAKTVKGKKSPAATGDSKTTAASSLPVLPDEAVGACGLRLAAIRHARVAAGLSAEPPAPPPLPLQSESTVGRRSPLHRAPSSVRMSSPLQRPASPTSAGRLLDPAESLVIDPSARGLVEDLEGSFAGPAAAAMSTTSLVAGGGGGKSGKKGIVTPATTKKGGVSKPIATTTPSVGARPTSAKVTPANATRRPTSAGKQLGASQAADISDTGTQTDHDLAPASPLIAKASVESPRPMQRRHYGVHGHSVRPGRCCNETAAAPDRAP
jgi:hypothetical protein